ncbi:MAG: phosphatidylglycerol lysyltransferase domain-containing protein, partial [Burkholderiales bacterium]|nr:phosphatidylglycerol lysyltransferase domain-containing protein [Burkholderiales bacterium]
MRIELQPVTIETLPLLKEHLKSLQTGDCNLSLASLIGRSQEYRILYGLYKDDLFLNWQPYNEVPPSYVFPWQSPNIGELLLKIEGECHDEHTPLILFGRFTELTEHIHRLQRYRNFMSVSCNEWWDYLYDRKDFVTLEGRKLNGKRNFNKRFNAAHPDAKFEILNKENIPRAREYLEEWYKAKGELTEGLIAERNAILEAFEYYDQFELFGGMLTDGKDQIFGFTYGSQVYEHIFAVHIEKASRDIVGA